MSLLFLPRPLCAPDLVAALGLDGDDARAAALDGYRLVQNGAHDLPAMYAATGQSLPGQVYSLTDSQRGKLKFVLATAGVSLISGTLDGQTVALPASSGADMEHTDDWALRMGPVWAVAAADIADMKGLFSPQELRERLPMILSRAHSRAMAQTATRPDTSGFSQADVEIEELRQPYIEYFAVQEFFLRHKTYAGGESDTLRRAVFLAADAVTVLPWDPTRDRVLVVEQFRAGPLARGDQSPWLMEPVAGRIEPGDTAEETARKETLEEAGLELHALHKIAGYYPSAGAFSEYLVSYIGIADLPDGSDGLHGLEEEGEDIRAVIMPREELLDRIASGEIPHGPLMISAYWLALNRARLLAG